MRSLWLIGLVACAADPVGFDGPVDLDQDGFVSGFDCDDEDPSVGAPTLRYRDADGDGFGNEAVETCDNTLGSPIAGDCNDTDNSVFPGAEERCNNIDDNCDGSLDFGAVDTELRFIDRDGDGYGDALVGAARVCGDPTGFSPNRMDCDDTDGSVSPEGIEVCGNGIDDNCDPTDCALRPTLNMVNLDAPSNDLGVLLTGTVPGGQFGATVVPAGDMNGDGHADLWVGAPGNAGDAGPRAHLFLGPLQQSGSASDLSSATLTAPSGVVAGHSIAAVGDIDEDGVDDAVIAEVARLLGQGRVHVVRGPLSGVSTVEAASMWSHDGEPNSGFGSTVAAIGDVNGDGRADFAVGAPNAQSNAGELHVYSSLLDPTEPELGDADWVIEGGANHRLGQFAPLNAGDLNGDGLDDLLIPSVSAGAIYVVFASDEPDPRAVDVIAAATIVLPIGASALGISLGHSPDVDGDGLPEFLVGAPAWQSTGKVALLHSDRPWFGVINLTTVANASIEGGRPGDELGSTVAGGDYDGDGVPDVLAGAAGALEGDDDGGAVALLGPFLPAETRNLNQAEFLDQIVWGQTASRASQVAWLAQDRAGHLVLGAPNAGVQAEGSVAVVFGNTSQ